MIAMNYYALLPISGVIPNIILILIVLYRNWKCPANRAYALTAFFTALWSLSVAFTFAAPDTETALLWDNISSSIVVFGASSFFTFFLVFTNADKKRRKYYIAVVYSLSAVIAVIALTTKLVTDHMETSYWGYITVPGLLGVGVFILFSFSIMIAGLILCARLVIRTPPGIEKKRAWTVLISLMVFVIGSGLTDAFPPMIGVEIMPMGSSLSTLTSIIIAYAILRYRLMSLTPSIAAKNIIKTMADYLLVMNKDGSVAFPSDSILKALGYKNAGRMNENLAGTFSGKMFESVIKRVEENEYIRDLETTLKTSDGKKIPVSLNGSLVKGGSGETLGYVLIMRDMTHIHKLIQSLQERTKELEKSKKELEASKDKLEDKMAEAERFNKLAVGRELKMIELKKRLKEAGIKAK